MLAFVNDTGILVVVLALVLLFGASRLPKLARNLGEAGKEFRKAHDEAAPASHDEPVTVSPPLLEAPSLGRRQDSETPAHRHLQS